MMGVGRDFCKKVCVEVSSYVGSVEVVELYDGVYLGGCEEVSLYVEYYEGL